MTGSPHRKRVVVIPAYRPTKALVELVSVLSMAGESSIVLVDDGSGGEWSGLFERAAALPGVELLRHPANLGKGAALKTGMRFALERYPQPRES